MCGLWWHAWGGICFLFCFSRQSNRKEEIGSQGWEEIRKKRKISTHLTIQWK